MAGLYLHIPFCKQACHYCDFHFSTLLQQREAVLAALVQELELQQGYLAGEQLSSVYFGGGTPSLLTEKELDALFTAIHKNFSVHPQAEITLEANPDDLDLYTLNVLHESPVNRLSIGIQSFREEDLKLMNRAHAVEQARDCLRLAKEVGFEKLTADLIYAMPNMSDADWVQNLDALLQYDLPHFSAYALTVEAKTALHKFVKDGKVQPASDADQKRQFDLLIDMAVSRGYEHYEISNFAKPGQRAVHNSSYWKSEPYLGIGPSAHSFNGHSRQWNVSNNTKYVQALSRGELPATVEQLSIFDQLNEQLLTGLRTSEGVNLARLEQRFGPELVAQLRAGLLDLKDDWYQLRHDQLVLTRSGKHFADLIASDLFILADDEH
ncbi:MAG: radical SAM family heme chaperone HemW [Sphingobacteriaceae bacterium]|nr:radical SAM family heme chaperone HemW [Sphingobacteriaceae bacterium]